MKVTVNKPNIEPGAPVEVLHLGLFENGTTTELDREGDDVLVGEPLETKPPAVKTPAELEAEKLALLADQEAARLAAANNETKKEDA